MPFILVLSFSFFLPKLTSRWRVAPVRASGLKKGNWANVSNLSEAMDIFEFHNANWAHLSRAIAMWPSGWAFPDNVRLAVLLELTPAQIKKIGGLSVKHLHLSVRRSQSLAARGTATVAQLLHYTIAGLLGLPNMGHGSVIVVISQLLSLANSTDIPDSDIPQYIIEPEPKKVAVVSYVKPVCHLAPHIFASQEDLEPLTLRREWELFSGLPTCAKSLPLEQIAITNETRCCLRKLGIDNLRDLLDQNLASLCERIGNEMTEEALDAVAVYAAEVRLSPNPSSLFEPVQDQEARLASRWGHCPVSELKLPSEATRALKRANVATVSELLTTLEPLHVELALDPFAFSTIWMRLQEAGLRKEAWDIAGERLSAEAYPHATLDHVLSAWSDALRPGRWDVASARLGLRGNQIADKKEVGSTSSRRMPTLYEVAATFGVTAERVRQIEIQFLKRLTEPPHDYFVALENTLKMIIFQADGIISLPQAVQDLSEWINPGQASSEGFCRLILNHSRNLITVKKNTVYALSSQPYHLYQNIIDVATSFAESILEEPSLEELAEMVEYAMFSRSGASDKDKEPPTRAFIAACLRAADGFSEGVNLSPKVALVRLLRELGSPRHFTEIASRLNEKGERQKPIPAKSVHNYLLDGRDLFVYVSPGTYGLVEWGLEDRRMERRNQEPIGDIVVEFLEAQGIPATKEEIIAFVLARKKCHVGSIALRLLYDDRFHRFDKDKYGLSRWTF